ncbi:MAG: hypothetical protein OH339_01305, partial [Candidatus Parvarchaeota archaeon]|nr:hypothetical protein [Candidatus Haiyanarchaeum thermophilum]
ILGQEIHFHLPNLVAKLYCPSYGGETMLYLSRQKFEREEGKVIDVKYYYNCSRALDCNDKKCIFRRSIEFFGRDERENGNKMLTLEGSKSF